MQRKYRNRLLKLAAFLEKLPAEKFDISNWITKLGNKNGCGTVACAVGWCPKIFPTNVKLLTRVVHFKCNKESPYGFSGPAEFFGISVEQSFELFSEDSYQQDRFATPKDVAGKIRLLLLSKETT